VRSVSACLCAFALTAVIGGLLAVTPAQAQEESTLGQDGGSVILVLDGSGSMKEPAGDGQTRMEAAKDGLRGVIDKLPADSSVGLRLYGSTISDGPGSCKDSELVVPVEKVDKDALAKGVDSLQPLGNTPIAYALEQAVKDLPSEGPTSIVLVSDGEENCGGDPCEVARDLSQSGHDLYVDVVGLQVNAAARNQLTCIASAGGGTYYDVKDIEDLPSTLTRTTVRGARGYEPAGKPVEGGKTVADAAPITDGQWLDTVGDSAVEYYEIADPGPGTLHVSATTPPSSDSSTAAETISLEVSSADGTVCGSGRAAVQGASNAGSPFTATFSATPEIRKSCGKGPYTAAVDAPSVTGVQPLEVQVLSEPDVESVDGLPGEAQGSRFSDDAQGDTDASAEAVPVIGSPNFAGAPPVEPGVYSDTILSGETMFYRVPGVDWGQQVVCDIEVQPAADAKSALADSGFEKSFLARAYGPLKSPLVDLAATTSRALYDGSEPKTAHAATPPVRYLNRESADAAVQGAALDGDYYCALTAQPLSGPIDKEMGEVPIKVAVSVIGTAGEGAPAYAAASDDSSDGSGATAASDDDGSTPWALIAAGVVVLVVLLALLWWALRRRSAAGVSATESKHVD